MSDIMAIVLLAGSIILLLLTGASVEAARRSFLSSEIRLTLRWGFVAALAFALALCAVYWGWAKGTGLV